MTIITHVSDLKFLIDQTEVLNLAELILQSDS